MPPGSLSTDRRKARYGIAYLRSVASQAGMPLTETSPDEDVLATDCTIDFPEVPIRVQVKCTSTRTIGGKTLSISADPTWIRKWEPNFHPVYLVVVIVPKSCTNWLRNESDGTFHATAAYWARLKPDEISTRIKVPKSQRLCRETFEQWHAELLAGYAPVGAGVD